MVDSIHEVYGVCSEQRGEGQFARIHGQIAPLAAHADIKALSNSLLGSSISLFPQAKIQPPRTMISLDSISATLGTMVERPSIIAPLSFAAALSVSSRG